MKFIIDNFKKNIVFFSGLSLAIILIVISFVVYLIRVVDLPVDKEDILLFRQASFVELKGWAVDNQLDTLLAFTKSCNRILKRAPDAAFGVGGFAGKSSDWQEVCKNLQVIEITDNEQAREFFINNFNLYEMWNYKGRDGLFTGYYEPTLKGSLTRSEKYNVPIYSRPSSMIQVDLGLFHEDLKGRSITGRVDGTKFIPYYNRAEIEAGALAENNYEIVWAESAIDVFFLHIQGSGRVELENGEVLRVGYAAQNGYAYTAIGRNLIAMGAVPREQMSMQAIRKWLEENPEQAQDIMNINASYIFFQVLDVGNDGPLGAEGISLTPHRSIAVDRKKIPYGVPLWLDAEMPSEDVFEGENPNRIQRLMVAQDTGGAIRGSIRGDYFWGAGDDAEHYAGLMKSKGNSWLLLPKSVIIPEDRLK